VNYALEMGSGTIIHIPSFLKIESAIQKLMGGYIDIQTARRSHKHTFIFQNKESRLTKLFYTVEYLTHPLSGI
jgi:hypothetical protein